jgi:hypothetical protein
MFTDLYQCHVSQNDETQHLTGQQTEAAVKAKYGSTIPVRLVRAFINNCIQCIDNEQTIYIRKHKSDKFTEKLKQGKTLNLTTSVRYTVDNTELIYFKKRAIPFNLIDKLTTSTEKFRDLTSPKVRSESRSSKCLVFHMGNWNLTRKGDAAITLTEDTRNHFVHCKWWLEENKELIDLLCRIFKTRFPQMYSFYCSLVDKYEVKIGAWATVAINFDFGSIKTHTDKNDMMDGYCWVVPFGSYEHGRLVFPKMNISVNARPGDITTFLSYQLEHRVEEYSGTRYSLAFFTHQRCVYSRCNKLEWGKYT